MHRGLFVVACFVLACGSAGSPASPAPNAVADKQPSPAPAPAVPAKPAPAKPAPDPRAARGAELYGQMCAVCHGANGEGYKADQAPALAQQDYLASVTDEFLAVAIADGRTGTQMSAFAVEHGGPLTAADVGALVAFLRSWQRQPPLALDETPLRGDATRGSQIFERECAKCHGPTAPNLRLLNPQLLAHASNGFLRHAIRKGRPPTIMPGYESSLGPQGVEDVVAFLQAQPKQQPHAHAHAHDHAHGHGHDHAHAHSGSAPKLPPPLPLGPVPLHPRGPEPKEFAAFPKFTPVAIVAREYKRKAKMVLMDARVPSDYLREHIAGAVSVPFYDPSPYLDKLPKNAWLVAYCGCPHAESGALAQKLMAAGFEKVTVLDEGLWDWKQKGHPMKVAAAP